MFYGAYFHDWFSDLFQVAFEKCGRVTDVFNSGKGFAFVTFARAEDANAAIDEMDGEMLNGRKISVKEAKPRKTDERASEIIDEAFQRFLYEPPSMWGPVNSGNWWLQPGGRHPF